MKTIKTIYPEVFQTKLRTQSITYLIRNIFSYYKEKDHVQQQCRNELIEFIKMENDLNWLQKNIDDAIPLTYTLCNKEHELSDLLIQEKYNLTKYDTTLSDALSCVMVRDNFDYFKKILKIPNIHLNYIRNMAVSSVLSCNYSGLDDHKKYNQHLFLLPTMHTDESIRYIAQKIIQSNDSTYEYFMLNNNFDIDQLMHVCEIEFYCSNKFSRNYDIYKKMKMAYDLENTLNNKAKISKTKI